MDREAALEKNNNSRFAIPERAPCFVFLPCTLYYPHVCIYFEALDWRWCRAVGVSTLVGSGMCPGCIYAAVQDMRITEGALLRQRTQRGFHGAAACQCGYCQWAKIAANDRSCCAGFVWTGPFPSRLLILSHFVECVRALFYAYVMTVCESMHSHP